MKQVCKLNIFKYVFNTIFFIILVCGGIYSEPTGIIESPGYPSYYTEDQICIYEIIQPLGTSILLTFLDFHMEESSYPVCLFDFVEVN